MGDAMSNIKQFNMKNFALTNKANTVSDFKETPSKTQDGFFAHEVSTIVPEAVFGEKDAVAAETDTQSGYTLGEIKPQQLDQSKLVPLLVAALQEAIGRIEVLEAK